MSDIFEEMAADAVEAAAIPKDNELEGLAGIAQKQLHLEKQVEKQEEKLKLLKRELNDVQHKELPDAMMELGLIEFALATGEKISVKPFVSASISVARKEDAHTWLRNNGFGDLIKAITSVDTGRDIDAAERAREALANAGLTPETKESVHAGTLKAWLREQVEAGMPIPLELFGAFLGQKSTIKKGS